MNTPEHDPARPLNIARRCLRWLKRFAWLVLSCLAFYLFMALIGLIPVNRDFRPTPDGIEIWFISNPIHTDIILPIHTGALDWRERFPAGSFSVDARRATHVAIGWGNKEFYVNTPTWAELRFSTVVKALFWPSDSCMHVSLCTAEGIPQDARKVKISAAQYQRLVAFINNGFRHAADGSIIVIPHAAYGPNDAFFEGEGRYHCFNTCNCWTGRAMQAAGIRTGWYTPLPGTLLLYLPSESGT
jgi:uncharacterized protein (TIGR02117 family)